jgi:polysaccharide pyruvyl transferase WcaK-like protein
MSKNIMIIGSFSGGNFGDNLVLKSIVENLSRNYSDSITFTIPTPNPDFIHEFLKDYCVKTIDINIRRTYSFRFLSRNIIKELKNIDAIISTAGIFFDQKLWDPRFNFISSLLPILFISKKYNIKRIGLCIGVSKETNAIGKFFLKKSLGMHDLLILRDGESYNQCINYKEINKVLLKSDIAHCLLKDCKRVDIKNNFKIAINLSSYIDGLYSGNKNKVGYDDWINNMSKYLAKLHDIHGIKFFATTEKDFELNQKIISNIGNEIQNIRMFDLDYLTAMKDFSDIKIALSSRMHFCIYCTSLGLPTIALSYHMKVSEYMQSLDLNEFVFPIENIDYDKLDKKINKIYIKSEKYRDKILLRINDNVNKSIEAIALTISKLNQ